MDPLRVVVRPRGKAYIGECAAPEIIATGASAEEAAENARVAALTSLGQSARPPMMLLRITEPEKETIVMQPSDKAVAIACVGEELHWRYSASSMPKIRTRG